MGWFWCGLTLGFCLAGMAVAQAAELSLSQFGSVSVGQDENQAQRLVGAPDIKAQLTCAHGSRSHRQPERWAWHYLPAATARDPQISTLYFEQDKLTLAERAKPMARGVDFGARGQATTEAVRRIHREMSEGEVRLRLGMPDRVERERCAERTQYDIIKRLVYLAVDGGGARAMISLRAGRVTEVRLETGS